MITIRIAEHSSCLIKLLYKQNNYYNCIQVQETHVKAIPKAIKEYKALFANDFIIAGIDWSCLMI
jgi:hypothetical protein